MSYELLKLKKSAFYIYFYIEDLTRVVISYEIYETSLWRFHKFHMK